MKSNFILVGDISDHIFARFLNRFGDWRHFSFQNITNFINKKTNKVLAHCIYTNGCFAKKVFINEDFYVEYKNCIDK